MTGFRNSDRKHFPLTDIKGVVNLFRDQLEGPNEPNLALLSITLGCIENTLTLNRAVSTTDDSTLLRPIFPIIDVETVDVLYSKFEALIKGNVDLTKFTCINGYSTRDLVKKISDVVWGSLSRSFKDKAHLQSLYSFLTGNKLDCFGVAFGVVAAAQILGKNDIHLALSEDHAWVVFGEDGTDTAEVTWHGKGVEDKRGQSITLSVAEGSWLYLNNHAIVCDRKMEVSAIVSAVNPAINFTTDSIELGSLQQELLWLLRDKGCLARYPMALGNLGDLEEISPSPGRPTPLAIFQESIDSAVRFYDNHHVYPYTYMGGFLYRKKKFREAIRCWAEASNVIRQFNYTKEDEEIYKEFLEIANELLPNIVKTVSAYPILVRFQLNILYSPEVYANILRFYDGICQWEEGSSTPVLHVGWAQHLTFTLNKFDPRIRAKIDVGKNEDDSSDESQSEDENANESLVKSKKEKEETCVKIDEKTPLRVIVDDLKTEDEDLGQLSPSSTGCQRVTARGRKGQKKRNTKDLSLIPDKEISRPNTWNRDDKIKSTIKELESKVGEEKTNANPSITALAQQCSLNILNKDYLLGSGEPFSSSPATVNPTEEPIVQNRPACSSTEPLDEFLSTKSNGSAFVGLTMDSMLKAESPADMMLALKRSDEATRSAPVCSPSPSPTAEMLESLAPVKLELKSEKMKGMKKMFTSAKLNASAIKLQLTAQSQVNMKHSRFFDICEPSGSARKRTRREI